MNHDRAPDRKPAAEDEIELDVSDLAQPDRAPAGDGIQAERAAIVRPACAPAHVFAARPRRRLLRQASSAVIVLAALLAIALGFEGAPLALHPQRAGMTCLVDAAWSPDSARVAVLGIQHDSVCPDYGLATRAGLLLVYDTNTGHTLATIQLDHLIIPALMAITQGQATSDTIATALRYLHVVWSPDQRRLAVTFWVDTQELGTPQALPNGLPANLAGVLLLDAHGAHAQVFTGLVSAYVDVETLWDLARGRLIAGPAVSFNPSGFGLLVPALGYRWQADGTLAPVGPTLTTSAPPPASPPGPVGVPDGSAMFTLWQPGSVMSVAQVFPQQVRQLPGVFFWQDAPLAAWSRDGRYLLDGSAPEGLLLQRGTPSPSLDDLNAFNIGQAWRLPLRDGGLAAVLLTVNPNNQEGVALAWRPDGRVLAAYTTQNADGSLSGALPVTLYDCASGRLLATLRPPAQPGVVLINGQSTLLRWSPDGRHLLLFNERLGVPLLWGPRNLP